MIFLSFHLQTVLKLCALWKWFSSTKNVGLQWKHAKKGLQFTGLFHPFTSGPIWICSHELNCPSMFNLWTKLSGVVMHYMKPDLCQEFIKLNVLLIFFTNLPLLGLKGVSPINVITTINVWILIMKNFIDNNANY